MSTEWNGKRTQYELLSRAASIAIVATAMALSTGVQAQSPTAAAGTGQSGQLEEIVVTAQKRSENLQKVPIAVTAVSSQQLQAAGVVNTTGLSTLVSGLSVQVQAGNFQPRIRGIGTAAFGPGIENPVALYIDGVYIGAQVTGLTDLTDVAQVTVLKGPQGTLFGRNSTGGVIQLATREPVAGFGGVLRTELDNYLTTRNNAYVTGGSDTLKSNLSLSYTKQFDGWGTNLATGHDNHKIYHDFSARSKILFAPGQDTSFKFIFDYADRADSMGPNLVPVKGTQPLVPGFVRTSNPYDSATSLDSRSKVKYGGVSLDAEQDLGFAKLVSISGYRQYAFRSTFDVSGGPVPLLQQFSPQKGKQFSQELQLVSAKSDTFNWVVGAFYLHAKDELSPTFEQNQYNQLAAPFTRLQIFEDAIAKTDSLAGFAQATVKILPDTRLTGGIRYTSEKQTLTGRVFGFGYFGNIPAVDLSTGFQPADNRVRFKKLTWRAALDHNFTPDILGYASYNRGFKSGGFNAYSPFAGVPGYRPETVDSYEGGLKTELFDRRVRVNVAGFYNTYKDIQVLRLNPTPQVFNAANARTYGADVDFEAKITSELRLTGGFEYLDAKFTGNSTGTITTGQPGGGTMTTLGSISGNPLPYAPRFTSTIGFDYTKQLDWGEINFNVTDSHNSGFYGAEDKNPKFHQRAYDYLNVSAKWTSVDGALTVGLFGRNLFDRAVATQKSNIASGFAADYANPPRTLGGTLTYRFGNH